jgi:hypothetical protein
MSSHKDDKVNQVLQSLNKLAYPTECHGIPTGVFHDAMQIISDFKTQLNNQEALIAQAEERGAKWALEEHGHGLTSMTREEYAKHICESSRKFSKVISGK